LYYKVCYHMNLEQPTTQFTDSGLSPAQEKSKHNTTSLY
jgi:hypothetical protein